MARKLSVRHSRFVDGLLKGLAASRAYQDAGYKARGNSAEVNAARLLRNRQIAAELERRRAKAEKAVDVSVERVLTELSVVGFSSIDAFEIDDEGRVKVREGYPPELIRAVSSIDRTVTHFKEGRTIEVKIRLWNKPQVLDILSRHTGVVGERPTHQVTENYVLVVQGQINAREWMAQFSPGNRVAISGRGA